MPWEPFHHPDISLPVIRRRACDELITILAGSSELLLSRGLSTVYGSCSRYIQITEKNLRRLMKRPIPNLKF